MFSNYDIANFAQAIDDKISYRSGYGLKFSIVKVIEHDHLNKCDPFLSIKIKTLKDYSEVAGVIH